MRSWFCLTAVLVLTAGGPAAEPAVEVRVRSVNDLLDKAEYLGGVVNQAEAARQGVGFLRALVDVGGARGIEGLDPARPLGLYANFTKDVIDSPVVLLVPIADEEAFLNLLSGKLGLEPKKGEGGTYEVQVPNVPTPVFFRFANRHVYATIRSRDGVAEKNLIDPKAFFAGMNDDVASLRLHIDRIPADVRKTLYGQFELQLNDAKAVKDPGETPARRRLKAFALDQFAAVVNSVVTDGKTVTVRVGVEPKSDELALTVSLTPAGGTPLARVVRDASAPSAAAVVLADVKNPVASGSVRLALPGSVRDELAPIIDALVKEEVEKAKQTERQAVRMVLDAVAPTLKAGVLDAAAAVTADDDRLRLLAGLKVAEGATVEKTIRTFAPFLPEEQGKVEFDVRKAGGFPLHRASTTDPRFEEVFGTRNVWVATGSELLLVGVEPDGRRIAAVAESAVRPKPVRPLTVELSVARLLGLAEQSLTPETMKRLTSEAFPTTPIGNDTVKLTVDGGDALTARLVLKGSAVRLAVLVDQEKKK